MKRPPLPNEKYAQLKTGQPADTIAAGANARMIGTESPHLGPSSVNANGSAATNANMAKAAIA